MSALRRHHFAFVCHACSKCSGPNMTAQGATEESHQGPGTHLRAPSSSHHGAAIMRGANQACLERGAAPRSSMQARKGIRRVHAIFIPGKGRGLKGRKKNPCLKVFEKKVKHHFNGLALDTNRAVYAWHTRFLLACTLLCPRRRGSLSRSPYFRASQWSSSSHPGEVGCAQR